MLCRAYFHVGGVFAVLRLAAAARRSLKKKLRHVIFMSVNLKIFF